MLFRSCRPRAPLDGLVEDLWLYEGYGGRHAHERILPSGTFEMVFNLRQDELRIYGPSDPGVCRRFSGAVVSGPYAGAFMSDIAEEAALLGVHFRPGGAAAFLGMPAAEFADAHVDLRTLWGAAATCLWERLCAASAPAERFRLVEQALLQRLAGVSRRSAVAAGIRIIAAGNGAVRIRDVAGQVGLSGRRFAELFSAEVGLSPKLFARVRRFQHAVDRSSRATPVDWAELALECGYFDQSHLIHEFTAFSGVSPADYRRRHAELRSAGAHVKRHHLPLLG